MIEEIKTLLSQLVIGVLLGGVAYVPPSLAQPTPPSPAPPTMFDGHPEALLNLNRSTIDDAFARIATQVPGFGGCLSITRQILSQFI